MKPSITYLLFLLVISCKGKQHETTIPAQPTQANDSLVMQNDRETKYVDRAHLDLKKYFVTVTSAYYVPATPIEDSSFYTDGMFLLMRDKTNNTTDTLPLEMESRLFHDMKIEDYSDSLHFKTLLLHITWTGDSDVDESQFVEYNDHAIKGSFEITNLVTLQRKDDWTLSGFVARRDELVYSSQSDYPVTVSLKDYGVDITEPAKQYIGYGTTALANIRVYRDRTLNEATAYTIRKGRELQVDTLYRSLNLVRLIVSDSLIFYARPDKIREKIQVETAG